MGPGRERLQRSRDARGDAIIHAVLGLCAECVPVCYHDGYYFVEPLNRAFCRDCGVVIPEAPAKRNGLG
jgi:hypothetical protein